MNSLSRPILFAPLCFLAGGFWVKTILNNYNSLKSHNSLFRGILTHLNTDDKIISILGDNIHYNENLHPFVKGNVNNIKGTADLIFYVKGSKQKNALVTFKGKKFDLCDFWFSTEFSLQIDKNIISL